MSESEMAKGPCGYPPHPKAPRVNCQGLETSSGWRQRQAFWSATHQGFDVIIIGGGIQGACLYHQLVRDGRRVLLIDRGDFGGGTSQASSMLVWGGLLYLKNFDIATVIRLCAARDRLIQHHAKQVEVQRLTFLFGERPHRRPWAIHAALRLYWLLALGRRRLPNRSQSILEREFLRDTSALECLSFEEGHLRLSDAQFVFDWIERAQSPGCHGVALNYCEAVEGHFEAQSGRWKLELLDTLGGGTREIATRWIVNAAGVWVDRVNSQFGMESPWQHLLVKGASITFARPKDHSDVLVFDDVGEREGMSLVPWGPVSLWGSTEKMIRSLDEGFQANSADVAFLLDSLNRHVVKALRPEDIIALRCGVRPIVVRRGQATGDPLSLSKRWHLWRDSRRPWISIYGGKLTTCQSVARRTSELLHADLGMPLPQDNGCSNGEREPEMDWLVGLHVPSAQWCVEHRMCWTLEDYLRRRTNVAQWIPRGGLGKEGEHGPQLAEVARSFAVPGRSAADLVQNYERRIACDYDRILGVYPSKGSVP